jgi:hypothetical protein
MVQSTGVRRRVSITLLVLAAACGGGGGDAQAPGPDASDEDTTTDGGFDDGQPSGDEAISGDARPPRDGATAPDASSDLPPVVAAPCGGKVHCVHAGDDLQAAINGAADGDVIQVEGATFQGNFRVTNKSLLVAGGFDASFASRDPSTHETRLDAKGSGTVVAIDAQGKTVRVDGFTITGGTGDPTRAYQGAGLYVGLGAITVSNNVITANVVAAANIGPTDTRGGGLIANGDGASVVLIVSNRVEGNVSGRGAGISSSDVGTLLIAGNVIQNNRGYSDHGGGVFVNSPNATLRGNWIEGNEIGPAVNPYGYGGGVYVHQVGTTAHLSYNTYTKNKAPSTGSGFFVDNGAHATLDHELFYDNACPDKSAAAILVDATDDANPIGSILAVTYTTVADHPCHTTYDGNGLMVVGPGSQATVETSIFWNNGPNQFADAVGGTPPMVSDSFTTADPMFVDATNGDFHLKPGSPAAGFGRY